MAIEPSLRTASAGVDLSDLANIYDLRRIIEVEIGRRSVSRMTKTEIEAVRRALVSFQAVANDPSPCWTGRELARGDAARGLAQQMSAITATMLPVFMCRGFQVFCFSRPGTLEATSFYDTTLLKATLERLVECRKRLRSQAHRCGR